MGNYKKSKSRSRVDQPKQNFNPMMDVVAFEQSEQQPTDAQMRPLERKDITRTPRSLLLPDELPELQADLDLFSSRLLLTLSSTWSQRSNP